MSVICYSCFNKYALVYSEDSYPDMDKTQGIGCASFKCDETHTRCFYGSKYDDMKFKWIDGNPYDGNICDECIEKLLNNGVIIDVTQYPKLVPNP